MSVVLIGIIGAILIYCALEMRKPHQFPPGPSWLPVIGNLVLIKQLHSICGFYHLVWHYLAKQYGPVVGIRAGRDRLIIISGKETIRQFYAMDEFSGRPDGFFYRIRSFEKRLGVVFTDGPHWEEQRSFSLKTLRLLGMGRNAMVEHVEREAAEMVKHFEALIKGGDNGRAVLPMEHAFDVSVLNIMWALLAGHRFSLSDERLPKLIELIHASFRVVDMTGGVLNQFPFVRYIAPDRSGYRPLVNTLNPLWVFLKEVITDIGSSISRDEPRSLIEAFLQEINKHTDSKTETTFTDEQLLSLCLDLFQSGTETTSNTLAFGLLYMLHNPHVLQKLRTELDMVIGCDRMPNLNDRSFLPYTEAVLCEIQRIANVAPVGIVHRCTKTTKLGAFVVPKDTMALVSLYSLHMDPDYWRDPNTFRPERFIGESGELITHPNNFYPFGAGKRRCMGEHMAKSSLYLFFSTFVHSFDMRVADGDEMPDTIGTDGITLSPKPFKLALSMRRLRKCD